MKQSVRWNGKGKEKGKEGREGKGEKKGKGNFIHPLHKCLWKRKMGLCCPIKPGKGSIIDGVFYEASFF